ncbi:MAG: DNA-processing protein DprA [Bacteroidaceae bacterium]|nr:DNA-processing protein DprA [Bacteroidaceae bacterium]
MNEQETIYLLALACQTRINKAQQLKLIQTLGSATEVFENRHDLSNKIEELNPKAAHALDNMESVLQQCESELKYSQDHHIRIIGWGDDAYPTRLRNCEDAPLVFFFLGNANLNAARVVSIVGTRRCTERGHDICESFVKELSRLSPDTLIVSGLAYGIDIAAHRASLNHKLPTVGVLAHGLDELYPRTHRSTAVEMLKQGGLITEYMSKTRPEKMNFVQRNRIVAGIADAVIVVESAIHGGSLITADIAFDYNRDVFAFPGRINDSMSAGCNDLIGRDKARLITSAENFLENMGWMPEERDTEAASQPTLFPTLSPDEQKAVDTLFHADRDMSAPEIASALNIPLSRLTPLMISLEMKGIVRLMAGNTYHLIDS